MSGRVQRTPLADQAARLLLDRIRDGEWSLGAKIPGETTLAAQLGVGRSTMREAIRQLVGRGVLFTRQGSGVFLAALDAPDGRGELMSTASIVDVIDVRIALESEAASLAANRRTPARLRAIRRALTARAAALDDVETHVDADLAFHRAIVEAAENTILTDLYDTSTPRIREAMIDMLRLVGRFGSADDHAAHEDLADAIADRRAADAARVSRDHLIALKEALQ